MNFKEFFTGTQEEKDASKQAEKLRQKKKPRRRDLDKIQRFQKIARKRFVRLALSALLSLGVAGGILAGQSDGEKKEAPAPPVSKKAKTPRKPLPRISENVFLSPKKIRSIYDHGFDMIMDQIGDSEGSQLAKLKKFKNTQINWAEIKGDNAVYPLESGYAKKAWIAVYSLDHPDARIPTSILSVDNHPTMHILRIRPQPITPEWAGVTLVHEMSHLYDRAYGVEPIRPSRYEYLGGEVRAYEAEFEILNRFTDNNYSKVAARLVKDLNINGPEDLIPPGIAERWANKALVEFDKIITPKYPLSIGEEALRTGLCQFALAFASIESRNLDPESEWQEKIRAVEVIMSAGQNKNHIPKK